MTAFECYNVQYSLTPLEIMHFLKFFEPSLAFYDFELIPMESDSFLRLPFLTTQILFVYLFLWSWILFSLFSERVCEWMCLQNELIHGNGSPCIFFIFANEFFNSIKFYSLLFNNSWGIKEFEKRKWIMRVCDLNYYLDRVDTCLFTCHIGIHN